MNFLASCVKVQRDKRLKNDSTKHIQQLFKIQK